MATRKKTSEPVSVPAATPAATPVSPAREVKPTAPKKKKPVVRKRAGAPSLYTDKLAEELCRRVANGERLTRICKEPGMPQFSTIWGWENDTEEVNGVHTFKYPKFAKAFARARIAGAEYGITEAGDLVDNAGQVLLSKAGRPIKDDEGQVVKVLSHEAIAHARSQANYRQWMAERVVSRYRPKQTVEQTGPNGGPLQNMNMNANADFDRSELTEAFKTLLDKGI